MATLLIGDPVQQHNDEELAQKRNQIKPMADPAEYQGETHYLSVFLHSLNAYIVCFSVSTCSNLRALL